MRQAFFKTVEELARTDKDLYLLTGDLGFGLFEPFQASHPDRFIDMGIAEQNMIGVAAGLSISGKNVYVYSITPFITMRAYEHIRMDIAYHNLNVKLVGVGGGFSYGFEGISHYGIEELSMMRSMPNMNVVVPADPIEASLLAEVANEYPYPLYIRLGKAGEPAVHDGVPEFVLGKGMVLTEGSDVAIFAIGSMVHRAKRAVDILAEQGISATLVNMHTLKPLDRELVEYCAGTHRAVFTVEEHALAGGLGSAVAEVLAERSYNGIFRRIGIPDRLEGHVGSADYHREQYGLTAENISALIIKGFENNTQTQRQRHGLEGEIR